MDVIDHIGYAVKDIRAAMEAFRKLGYAFGAVVTDRRLHVTAVMGALGGVRVELVASLGGGQEAPVDGYLKKMGNAPYHVCYRVDDVKKAVGMLKGEEFFLVSPPAYYELLDGVAAFMFSIETGLIELVERSHGNGQEGCIGE